MEKRNIRLAFALALSLTTSLSALSQTEDLTARSSFAPRISYSWFAGDWSRHRFASGVDLFKSSISFGADLEFRLSDSWTLALDGGYGSLNASDWESYARARGDNISVSGSLVHLGLLIRPHVSLSPTDIIKIEVGPLVMFAKGEEVVGGKSYDYDFFKSFKIGGQGGLEYDRLLKEKLAVFFKVTAIVVPSGAEYADGRTFTLVSIPMSVGLRLFFK